MRIPDFFIVGAAKAGTTSLTSQLKACPSVFMTKRKEPEFFARDDRFARGTEWYSELFSDAKPGQITGESSTIYSLARHFPNAARRIWELAPDARIIYMLRHPVDRSYSMYQEILKHYQMSTRSAQINRSFEEFLFPEEYPDRSPRETVFARYDAHLPDDPMLFLDGSDYARQAREYLAFFPRNSVKFILFEDYVKDRGRFLRDVLSFLGVDPDEALQATSRESRNVSRDHFAKTAEHQQIRNFKSRYVPGWLNDILPGGLRQQLRGVLLAANRAKGIQPALPAPMRPQTRDRLIAHFSSGYGEIERLTGLELSAWRQKDEAWRSRAMAERNTEIA